MSFLSRLWSHVSGGGMANPDEGEQLSGPVGYKNSARVNVDDERAMGVSAAFACTRLIVQSGSTLPIGFFRRTPEGREELDNDHPLCRLLKYKPNRYMTAKQFRQALWTQRVGWGNAYALKGFIGDRVVDMMPLKPAFMDVKRKGEGLRYIYSTDKGQKEYSAEQIMHIKGFSIDGMMGLSPLAYASYALGISVAADSRAARSFSSMPNMALEIPGWPNQEQRQQLREMYEPGTDMTGDGNFWFAPGGSKLSRISINPNELQMLESRQFQISEVCRFYGVPAVMVDGNTGATSAWPASYEQQVLSFLTFTLKPYLDEWEDQIVDSLVAPAERKDVFAEHNVDGLLRTDSAARATYLSSMVQNGLMTRNEGRRKLNLPPVEGGDDLTVQVNLAPVSDLEKVNVNRNDQ